VYPSAGESRYPHHLTRKEFERLADCTFDSLYLVIPASEKARSGFDDSRTKSMAKPLLGGEHLCWGVQVVAIDGPFPRIPKPQNARAFSHDVGVPAENAVICVVLWKIALAISTRPAIDFVARSSDIVLKVG
jgi:hypothetical protein